MYICRNYSNFLLKSIENYERLAFETHCLFFTNNCSAFRNDSSRNQTKRSQKWVEYFLCYKACHPHFQSNSSFDANERNQVTRQAYIVKHLTVLTACSYRNEICKISCSITFKENVLFTKWNVLLFLISRLMFSNCVNSLYQLQFTRKNLPLEVYLNSFVWSYK